MPTRTTLKDYRFVTLRYKQAKSTGRKYITVMFGDNKKMLNDTFDPMKDSVWGNLWLSEKTMEKDIALLRELGFDVKSNEDLNHLTNGMQRAGSDKSALKDFLKSMRSDAYNFRNIFELSCTSRVYNGKESMNVFKWVRSGRVQVDEKILNKYKNEKKDKYSSSIHDSAPNVEMKKQTFTEEEIPF